MNNFGKDSTFLYICKNNKAISLCPLSGEELVPSGTAREEPYESHRVNEEKTNLCSVTADAVDSMHYAEQPVIDGVPATLRGSAV